MIRLRHRLRQLLHVSIHGEAVSFGQHLQRTGRGPAFPLLDAAELAFGKPPHAGLADARLLTEFADGCTVPAVKSALRCWALRSSAGSTA